MPNVLLVGNTRDSSRRTVLAEIVVRAVGYSLPRKNVFNEAKAMRILLASIALITMSGCGNPLEFDPATTVILKISGVTNEAEKELIKEKAEELVLEKAAWRKTSMSEHAETVMIKLAPVRDVKGFADRITFGTVTAVDGNQIHLSVGDDQEDGGQDPASDHGDKAPHTDNRGLVGE